MSSLRGRCRVYFKKENEAKNFMVELEKRVSEYGLTLNNEKTKIINFLRTHKTSFNFLGFTFYWETPKSQRTTTQSKNAERKTD